MDEDDYYHILGVDIEANKGEIKRAYRRLASLYHPDKVEHLGPRLKLLAEDELKKLNDAKEILLDDKKRKKYDREIGLKQGRTIAYETGIEIDWDISPESDGSEIPEPEEVKEQYFPCGACGFPNKLSMTECGRCGVDLFEFLKLEYSLFERINKLEIKLMGMQMNAVNYFKSMKSLEAWYLRSFNEARERSIEARIELLSEKLIGKEIDPEGYFETISILRERWQK